MPPRIPGRFRLLQRHFPALAMALVGMLLQGDGEGLSPRLLLAADLSAAAFVVQAAPWLTRLRAVRSPPAAPTAAGST